MGYLDGYRVFWWTVFLKSASRGFEPTRDFGDPFTGLRLEAVVVTTPPSPRLRVKGVRIALICSRTRVEGHFRVLNAISEF